MAKLTDSPKIENVKLIYRLNYMKGNVQQFMLVQFSRSMELDELVKAAKQYCAKNNMRFVFIDPAVTIIDLEELEDVVE